MSDKMREAAADVIRELRSAELDWAECHDSENAALACSAANTIEALLAAIPTTDAEPFGYWVEQKLADPVLLRKPAYIPEPSELRKVTPLYAASPTPSTDVGVDEVRPDDEILDPHLPESIRGAKRCGIQRSAWLDGWFIPWSPRNDNANAEGAWSDWVDLAKAILAADAKAIAAIRKGER